MDDSSRRGDCGDAWGKGKNAFKGSTFTAGGVTYDYTGKNACDYFTDGKTKASTLSLSVLVVIEMFNAFNAAGSPPLHHSFVSFDSRLCFNTALVPRAPFGLDCKNGRGCFEFSSFSFRRFAKVSRGYACRTRKVIIVAGCLR